MANLNVNGEIMQWGGAMLPIGIMLPYAGKTIPKNFLLCDGSSFSQTEYPELYSVLGTNVLPNLIDRFLEGSSLLTSNANDSTRYVAAGLPDIQGDFRFGIPGRSFLGAEQATGAFLSQTVQTITASANTSSGTYNSSINFKASRYSNVYGKSTTVQPPAYKAAWMIKAK